MRCPDSCSPPVSALAAHEHGVVWVSICRAVRYLLLEVELDQVQKDRIESLIGDIRAALRKAHIGLPTWLPATATPFRVAILEPDRYDDAKTLVANLNVPSARRSWLSAARGQYDMLEPGNSTLVMKMTDAYKTTTNNEILGQSIEVVRRRIDSARHARSRHRAPGRRPHPGAGAGPAGSRRSSRRCSARRPR